MFAFTAALAIGMGMGLRLSLPTFLTTMLAASSATVVHQTIEGYGLGIAVLSGGLMLVALQSGYVVGILIRAVREERAMGTLARR